MVKTPSNIKRRPHTRKPLPQPAAPPVIPAAAKEGEPLPPAVVAAKQTYAAEIAVRNKAVLDFDLAFRRELPAGARNGSYAQAEGDRFDGQEYPIPDGAYRVHGSDWIVVFEGRGFVEAFRPQPPKFGGPDVIEVPGPDPARPSM